MADKKFGQNRVCKNCEVKFYDLNKKFPLSCPHCDKEVVIEEELFYTQNSQSSQIVNKTTSTSSTNEFSDLDNGEVNTNDNDDEIISLDDAVIEEEEQNSKN